MGKEFTFGADLPIESIYDDLREQILTEAEKRGVNLDPNGENEDWDFSTELNITVYYNG